MPDPRLCDCHDADMLWCRDERYRAGGFWRCRIRDNERNRRRYAENPEVRLDRQLRNLTRIRVSY